MFKAGKIIYKWANVHGYVKQPEGNQRNLGISYIV